MGTIEIQEIGTNRYAPEGANAECLYGVEGADGLTLGQLVAAVCIRRCTHLEARSVTRMNKMTQTNAYMQALSNVCAQVLAGAKMTDVANVPDSYEMRIAARGCNIRKFLADECQMSVAIGISDQPTYQGIMNLAGAIKAGMDKANTASQQDIIELQSLVNWRDTTYNMSSTIVARYSSCGMNTAEKL